jgi:hypothetical protein
MEMATTDLVRSPRTAARAMLAAASMLAAVLQSAAAGTDGFRLHAAESLRGPVTGQGLPLGIAAALADEPAAAAPGLVLPPDVAHPVQAPDTAQPAPAEDAVEGPAIPEQPYGWSQLRHTFGYAVRKPAHLSAGEKRGALAVAGATGLLYVFREDLQAAWRDSSSESRTDFLNSARITGGAGFAPAVALAAWAASFATDDEREKETAQLLMESWALAAVGSGVGSFVLAAERPEDGDDVHFFRTDGHGVSYDVSVAAAVIPPLRRQYLRVRPEDGSGRRVLKRGISALLYTGMVLTALQRIDADKHWVPDVFLGAVNGLAAGAVVCQAHDEAKAHRSRLGIAALPGGVSLTWTLSLGPS